MKCRAGTRVSGYPVQTLDQIKYLGVIIDCGLTWKSHIDSVSVKVAQSTGILSKLKHYLPRKILRSLYLTLHVSYCLPIWVEISKTHLNRLITLLLGAVWITDTALFNIVFQNFTHAWPVDRIPRSPQRTFDTGVRVGKFRLNVHSQRYRYYTSQSFEYDTVLDGKLVANMEVRVSSGWQ